MPVFVSYSPWYDIDHRNIGTVHAYSFIYSLLCFIYIPFAHASSH